ncbi:MAG: hypothetical protein CMH57_09960 [Myxococcales bacterium]|nr:hypothetical protein [Myxococcales bacterium]
MTTASQTMQFDWRGLSCPEPILKIARVARDLKDSGGLLQILADDEAFPADLESWCRSAGASLRKLTRTSDHFVALIAPPVKIAPSTPRPSAQPFASAPAAAPELAATPELATTPGPLVARKPAAAGADSPAAAAGATSANTITLNLSGLDPDERSLRLEAFSHSGFNGVTLEISADAPTFSNELTAWCHTQGHSLLRLTQEAGVTRASVALSANAAASNLPVPMAQAQAHKRCTLLVLHNDLEALLAALMVANASASMGMRVTIFFSFWGLNLLRAQRRELLPGDEPPSLIQRLMAWMMPRGPHNQKLGRMNMGGVGTALMGSLMKQKSVMDLQQLMESALEQDVRFMVCTTSMSIMGITRGDLAYRDKLEYGGVAAFSQEASTSDVHLTF